MDTCEICTFEKCANCGQCHTVECGNYREVQDNCILWPRARSIYSKRQGEETMDYYRRVQKALKEKEKEKEQP